MIFFFSPELVIRGCNLQLRRVCNLCQQAGVVMVFNLCMFLFMVACFTDLACESRLTPLSHPVWLMGLAVLAAFLGV